MQDTSERFDPVGQEGDPFHFAVYADDLVIAERSVFLPDPRATGEIALVAFVSFQTATSVSVHGPNGFWLGTYHRDRSIPIMFSAWWNADDHGSQMDVCEHRLYEALRASKRLESTWGEAMVEVEALGRLRAALRVLGGDL